MIQIMQRFVHTLMGACICSYVEQVKMKHLLRVVAVTLGLISMPATAVLDEPPVADPNGPYAGTVGSSVSFDGSGSSDPDGTIVDYAWDFGDGNAGTGVSPSHSYATAGTFTVTLTVTDDYGTTDSAGTTATIDPNDPPVADPNGPYAGTVGSPVSFDGSGSSDPDGTIVGYAWDFGDGNAGTGVGPSHSYATAGTFTVTLTVTDDDGATDAAGSTATIDPLPNTPPTDRTSGG
jgi:PKD repeat protein